jgi:cbb3-type cytochrome oxidase subunit 3
MKLSDIMSAAGLSGYAEIALILFLLAFLGVVAMLFHPARRRTFERARYMPLDDEHPQTPRPREE